MFNQKVQPRTYPPPPPEFKEEFVEGGWRRVERLYGARTDLIWKWIRMTGADVARMEAKGCKG